MGRNLHMGSLSPMQLPRSVHDPVYYSQHGVGRSVLHTATKDRTSHGSLHYSRTRALCARNNQPLHRYPSECEWTPSWALTQCRCERGITSAQQQRMIPPKSTTPCSHASSLAIWDAVASSFPCIHVTHCATELGQATTIVHDDDVS
jgi:hypothetical protein